MTEIQQYNPSTGQLAQQGTAAAFAPTDRAKSLVEYVAELEAAQELGNWLCQSMLAPPHLKNKGGEAAAVILMGQTLGLDPINAMSGVYAVHNTPALYARTMVALVQSAGHYIERTEATEQRVTWEARRRSGKTTRTFTWDMARAQRAGYTNNKKYQSDPIGMLSAKASAEACRVMFADVLMGMASVEEVELGDYDVVEVTEVPTAAPAPAVKRTAKRKAAPTPAPEPEAPAAADTPPDEPEHAGDTNPDEDPQPEAPEKSTRSQWARLSNALEAIGVTEKEDKVREMQDWAAAQDDIDRDVESLASLTKTEADRFLAYLEEIAAASQQTEEDQP